MKRCVSLAARLLERLPSLNPKLSRSKDFTTIVTEHWLITGCVVADLSGTVFTQAVGEVIVFEFGVVGRRVFEKPLIFFGEWTDLTRR